MSKRSVSLESEELNQIRASVKQWWKVYPRTRLLQEFEYDESEVDTLEEATQMILTSPMEDWHFTLEEMRDHWRWDALLE